MKPRLVGLDGPLQGEVFDILGDECILGRDPASTLRVPDSSVSRRHCCFRVLADGQVRISDLDSRNGTFVNGLPVHEHALEQGDEIRIGDCHFVFLFREEPAPDRPSAVLEAGPDVAARTVVRLRRRDALYLRPGEALEAAAEPAKLTRSLRALFRVSNEIRIARGLEELSRDLLELAAETVAASEGAVLLLEPGASEPAWSFGWRRSSGPARAIPAPNLLVRKAFEEDMAILGNQPGTPPVSSTTPDEFPIHSVLVTPLSGSAGVIGVLYLGSADPRTPFDEEQLQLMTAIGSISGRAIESAREFDRLKAENLRLREEIGLEHDLIGETPAMKAIYRFIAKVAPTDSTALITGESGTGKELVARAIHRNSTRRAGPFVAVNCAALTETLLESELFGHEKGAFTGAIALKKGKFEMADGGTIFLDEIAEMAPGLEAKLLRVLEDRGFDRVGGTRRIQADVRVIAATNRDLRARIADGAFREDLYYRLNVVSVRMPPLRERRADIPLLAAHFIAKHGRRLTGISREARERLLRYNWPGNVRELENALERAVVLGLSDRVLLEDLPEELLEATTTPSDAASGFHEAARKAKRNIILKAIDQAGGTQAAAAKLLGVSPAYLSRLIRNLDLREAIQGSREK